MQDTLKRRSLKSVFWAVGESFGSAALSFGTFLIMARLLAPQDFGVVALAAAFIVIFNLVTGHTFADALVQTRDLDDDHAQTAFWSTLAIAGTLAVVCIAAAESIAATVNEPAVAPVLVYLALVMPLNATGSVQGALLRRQMRFRTLAGASLLGRVTGALVGIAMALLDYGVWSLVAQQLIGAFLSNGAIAVVSGWTPRFRFSVARFRELAGFGLYVSVNQVLAGISEQMINLLVGSFYGSTALGYFTLAWRTVQLLRSLISSAVYHVGFSTFSRLQDDRRALSQAFLKATQLSCLVGFPLGVGLGLVAGPLILVFYGPKWEPSILPMSILALQLMPGFFGMFFTATYLATGRPQWELVLTLADLIVTICGVVALAGFPVWTVAVFWLAKSLAFVPIHVTLMGRVIGISPIAILRCAGLPLLASLGMGGLILAAVHLFLAPLDPLVRLMSESALGALGFLVLIRVTAREVFTSTTQTLRVILLPQQK